MIVATHGFTASSSQTVVKYQFLQSYLFINSAPKLWLDHQNSACRIKYKTKINFQKNQFIRNAWYNASHGISINTWSIIMIKNQNVDPWRIVSSQWNVYGC